MKIYVNENYEIAALYHTDREDLMEIEVERETLGNWCDTALLCFKYEPSYQYDPDKDEYILDEEGNKIQQGWAFYPNVDFNIIQSIQDIYDRNIRILEESNNELTIAMADMLGGAV